MEAVVRVRGLSLPKVSMLNSTHASSLLLHKLLVFFILTVPKLEFAIGLPITTAKKCVDFQGNRIFWMPNIWALIPSPSKEERARNQKQHLSNDARSVTFPRLDQYVHAPFSLSEKD